MSVRIAPGGSAETGRRPDIDAAGDPLRLCRLAGLRYVRDDEPGIARLGCGTGFTFRTPDGETLDRDGDRRARIDSLAIPPAWEDVWVSPDPDGHLQATGRDAAGRKQYLYHPRWAAVAGEAKWLRLAAFGRALPRLRRRVRADLRRLRLDKRKVCALAAGLLDATAVRVGGADYTRDHATYGLTTLRPEHATVSGRRVRLAFVGKHGVDRSAACRRLSLARPLARLKKRGGTTLLAYRDRGGDWHPLTSSKVNAYLKQAAGGKVTAKDFRTWRGSLAALNHLLTTDEPDRAKAARGAVEAAAALLGNTPAVCKQYYVHPAVPAAAGSPPPKPVRVRGLTKAERRLVRLLEDHAAGTVPHDG